MITEAQRDLLLLRLCPLGRVPKYENGDITFSETPTRRFVNDSYFVRRAPRSSALIDPRAYNPAYLGFGLKEALSVVLQDDYELYEKMMALCDVVDQTIAGVVDRCEQSAVLFNHSSFGERLFPHVHAKSNDPGLTVSLFFNLTKLTHKVPVMTLASPVGEGDKEYERGYTQHRILLAHERKAKTVDVPMEHGYILVFDSTRIPHSLSFNDDLWLTFVYDHCKINGELPDPIKLLESELRYHVLSIRFKDPLYPDARLDQPSFLLAPR